MYKFVQPFCQKGWPNDVHLNTDYRQFSVLLGAFPLLEST